MADDTKDDFTISGFVVKSYNDIPIMIRTMKQQIDYEFKQLIRWAVRHPNKSIPNYDMRWFLKDAEHISKMTEVNRWTDKR